jgi:hypothetical protein
MNVAQRLLRILRTRSGGVHARQRPEHAPRRLFDDGEAEPGLESTTAALSEGAPPAGAVGRTPEGRPPGQPAVRGPGEGDTESLPG